MRASGRAPRERRRSGPRNWLLSRRFARRATRRLMEARVAAGDRAEALRVYERCRRLLADELGAYPSPETESIYRQLLVAPAPEDGASTAPAGLTDVDRPERI